MKDKRTCPTHGDTALYDTVEQGGIEHEFLYCGCTIEIETGTDTMAKTKKIAAGDAVLYNNTLWRVTEITKIDSINKYYAKIANINCSGVLVPIEMVVYIAKDTLSTVVPETPVTVKYAFKKGSRVRNKITQSCGTVIEIKAKEAKCEVNIGDKSKYFIWPVDELEFDTGSNYGNYYDHHIEPIKPVTPVKRYWPDMNYSRFDEVEEPPRKEIKKCSVSTADFINDEVKSLAKPTTKEEFTGWKPAVRKIHEPIPPKEDPPKEAKEAAPVPDFNKAKIEPDW